MQAAVGRRESKPETKYIVDFRNIPNEQKVNKDISNQDSLVVTHTTTS